MKILACLILALCVSGCGDKVYPANELGVIGEHILEDGTRCVAWRDDFTGSFVCDFEGNR